MRVTLDLQPSDAYWLQRQLRALADNKAVPLVDRKPASRLAGYLTEQIDFAENRCNHERGWSCTGQEFAEPCGCVYHEELAIDRAGSPTRWFRVKGCTLQCNHSTVSAGPRNGADVHQVHAAIEAGR